MTIKSILRIDHDGEPLCLYRYDAQNDTCEVIQLNEWSDSQLSIDNLLVLVPASWVYHTQTNVASRNSELLTKSIPYAIEEELSNEVEDNYCAFRVNEDGSQDVIAIEKAHLNQLNNHIDTHQLSVSAIHSEVDWLHYDSQSISIWSESETALLKLGESQAMRVANSQVNQLLPIYAQDRQSIRCNNPSEISYSDLPIKNDLTEAKCCGYLLGQNAINLYIDAIKTKQKEASNKPWKGVKILACIWFISWIAVQGIQWFGLKQSIAEIKQQQVDLLRQNFPNAAAAELVDPFAALQSRLKVQNSQSTQDQSMLIDAVDKLGQTMKQQPNITLNGLRMIDQKLELQVAAPSLTLVNDFHQLLQQYASNFTVQIGVNELDDDSTFKSILTLVPR